MSSSSKWTLCVCLLQCVLNCSVSEVKTVQPGEDVLFLCQAPRGADIIFVNWIRPDLESEGSLFFFRDDRTYENYQHPSFHGRVELRDPQMKDGDVSVILKNVNIKDTGTYECFVRITESSSELISSLHLKVEDSDRQQITVKTGDDVTLQCLDHRGGDIVLVKWIRPDLQPGYVFFFRDDRTYENYQHPSFHGRVELRDPQMKDGDVSVILEKVNIKDTGTYECYVSYTGKSPELISSVLLTVKFPGFHSVQQQITVKTGDDVTLQCLDHRGGDIKLLEWTRQELEEIVFVCRHGKMCEDDQHPSFKNRVELRDPEMKDGDVSVILKKINIKDTGTYECYVRNKNTTPQPQLITIISLTVVDSGCDKDGGDKGGHYGLLVFLSLLIVLVVVVVVVIVGRGWGDLIYRKLKRLTKQICQPPVDKATDHELQDLTPEPKEKLKEENEETPVET